MFTGQNQQDFLRLKFDLSKVGGQITAHKDKSNFRITVSLFGENHEFTSKLESQILKDITALSNLKVMNIIETNFAETPAVIKNITGDMHSVIVDGDFYRGTPLQILHNLQQNHSLVTANL